MTPADLAEYKRRYALRQARYREVEQAVGYSAAPIRVWHFDGGGEADPGGQRVATDTRTGVRGRR